MWREREIEREKEAGGMSRDLLLKIGSRSCRPASPESSGQAGRLETEVKVDVAALNLKAGSTAFLFCSLEPEFLLLQEA